MTCIVGIKHDDKVYIGADSLGSTTYNKVVRADQKVFINGGMIFGFTSSFRMGQILQYSFTPPKHSKSESDMQYMVNTFIPAIMEAFSEQKYMKTINESATGGTFLVGYRGELYKIESDFQVGISMDNYDACGCGQDFALGSLHTTELYDIPVEERITMAISAASQFSTGVGGPINILSI